MVSPAQLTPQQQKELQEKLKNLSPEELAELQKQNCIFCQLVSGKIPSKKVYDDEHSIAILDINPAAQGHLILFPKKHFAIMPQMPDKELSHLYSIAQNLSQLLLRTAKVSGTTIFAANGLAAGQRAQHFVLHVIPRQEGDKLLLYEEKIVPHETQEKVRMVMINRLNELLGIKKEVIQVEEKEEIVEEEKAQPKKKETIKKTKKGKERPQEKTSLDDIANLFK